MTSCTSCDADLLHCHELVVEHLDGSVECSIDGCEVSANEHRFTATCDELFGTCLCENLGASLGSTAA